METKIAKEIKKFIIILDDGKFLMIYRPFRKYNPISFIPLNSICYTDDRLTIMLTDLIEKNVAVKIHDRIKENEYFTFQNNKLRNLKEKMKYIYYSVYLKKEELQNVINCLQDYEMDFTIISLNELLASSDISSIKKEVFHSFKKVLTLEKEEEQIYVR